MTSRPQSTDAVNLLIERHPRTVRGGPFRPHSRSAFARRLRRAASKAGSSAAFASSDQPVTIAELTFSNGDSVHFGGVPAHGQFVSSVATSDLASLHAFLSLSATPLRLYTALAAPDAPIPWLVVTADPSPGRMSLTAGRQIVDQLQGRVDVPLDTLASLAPRGTWIAADLTEATKYCGPFGERRWVQDWCQFDATDFDQGGVIRKCTSEYVQYAKHESRNWFGGWQRTANSIAICAICGPDPVRVQHRYRRGGKWQDAAPPVHFSPGDAAGYVGSRTGTSFFRYRRIVHYQRLVNSLEPGGLRAFTRFTVSQF